MFLLPMSCSKWNNPCFRQYKFKTKRLVEVSLDMKLNRLKGNNVADDLHF
jgi:hypothetical protein